MLYYPKNKRDATKEMGDAINRLGEGWEGSVSETNDYRWDWKVQKGGIEFSSYNGL